MAVNRPVSNCKAGAVEMVDHRITAEHSARHGGERLEQGKLSDRQADLSPTPERTPALMIQRQIANLLLPLWCQLRRPGPASGVVL